MPIVPFHQDESIQVSFITKKITELKEIGEEVKKTGFLFLDL